MSPQFKPKAPLPSCDSDGGGAFGVSGRSCAGYRGRSCHMAMAAVAATFRESTP